MKFFTVISCFAISVSAITPVSQTLFDQIKYYAGLGAAATIAAPCTTPPNGFVVQQQINTSPTWTNVSATIFRNDNTKEYVLAFSGTNNTANGYIDLTANLVLLNGNFPCGSTFQPCKVHNGFQIAYGSGTDSRDLAYMVRNAVKSITSARPTYALTLVGPSLGGALASLSFLDLTHQGYSIKAVWTYGEPRVGNTYLADLVDSTSGSTVQTPGNYYRVTHYDDGVVKLPPGGGSGVDEYIHSLTEYWFSKKECVSPNTPATTFRCVGREDFQCNFGISPTNDTVRDHISYPGYLTVSCANRPFPNPCTS